MKIRLLLLTFALFLCDTCARAVDWKSNVPGRSGVTYFELLKLVVSDLGEPESGAAIGQKTVAYQHIEGKDQTIGPPERITLHEYDVDAMGVPGDSSLVILLVDLGQQEGFVADVELLALFSLTPEPRLLDVVEVGAAQSTTLAQKAKPLMLAPKTPLIVVDSEHDDADESFISTEMIFVRRQRFQLIGDFSTFDEKECGYTLTEVPSYRIVPSSGSYHALDVAVRARVAATGEDCGETQKRRAPHAMTYRALYRWDERAQRFATVSKELQRLVQFNDRYP
jgi:hypothetical protein